MAIVLAFQCLWTLQRIFVSILFEEKHFNWTSYTLNLTTPYYLRRQTNPTPYFTITIQTTLYLELTIIKLKHPILFKSHSGSYTHQIDGSVEGSVYKQWLRIKEKYSILSWKCVYSMFVFVLFKFVSKNYTMHRTINIFVVDHFTSV